VNAVTGNFRWGALDHQTIERTLTTLKRQINKEILSGDHLTPIGDPEDIGTFRPHRLFHSFEVIQEERANQWVERVYKVYLDQWAAQGGEKTPDFIRAVWANALYPYVNDEVLPFLRLAFGVDDRAMKLLNRTFASLPQGIEASRRVHSVNRIYSAVIERWGSRTIPHEANTAELAISRRISKSPALNVPPVEVPPPRPTGSSQARSSYQRKKEKDLRERLSQDPANRELQIQLLEELRKQERLARELFDLQGPELAASVFGRTDVEIAEEIKSLRITLIISEDEIDEPCEVQKETKPTFIHSEAYDSISFNGESFTLQERQAAVVKLLHESLKKGHPSVPLRKILSLPGCEDVASIRDIFKSRPQLWGNLIINCEETGEGRGFYRLHPSITA
jgi:hypothetical protein